MEKYAINKEKLAGFFQITALITDNNLLHSFVDD